MAQGRPGRRHLAVLLAPILVAAAACLSPRAAVGGDDAASDPPDPLTGLEAGPLARADAVIVGEVHVVRRGTAGAPTLVRVDVEKTLKGDAVGDSVNLFVAGEKPTREASAPARSYFSTDSPGRYVLFLKRSPAGSGFTLETLFDAEGEIGHEKEEVLEKEVAISAIKDPATRRRRTLSHLLDLLGKEKPWSRMHAARELNTVAATAPEAFDENAIREIDAARGKASESGLRALLTDVIQRVAPGWTPKGGGATAPAGERSETSADLEPLRRRLREAEGDEARLVALTSLAKAGKGAAIPDLVAAFGDKSAPIRERAGVLLGDARAASALPTLLAAFSAEMDAGVREAVVRAVGLAGNDASVPWLVARTVEEGLERAVLFALARIRTPAALEGLAKERERILSLPVPDRATARLIDYLRGPAFVEAERAAGRAIGAARDEPEGGGGR